MSHYKKVYFVDIEPKIYRHRGIMEFHLAENSLTREQFKKYLKAVSESLSMKPHPEQPEPIVTSATGHSLEKHNGLEAMLFWLESGMHAYYWELSHLITLDMHSCAFLDAKKVIEVTKNSFTVIDYHYTDILPKKIVKK